VSGTPAPSHAAEHAGTPSLRAAVRALVRRPWLWPDALALALRMAPRGWWRAWPPRPVPDEAWWRFRMETAYGGAGDREPNGDDVVAFVDWCRNMGRWRKQ